jgi:putative transposase
VYVWADGIHFRVRLEQARLCCLVIMGVRADGTKELVAVCDGERESTDSWAELLRDLRRRGMRAPVVAVGDGALGLWAALRDVFPATRHQRDWVHKVANVLACLPKAVQAGARRALAEIRDAPNRDHARLAIETFAGDYGVKWPEAVAKKLEAAQDRWRAVNGPHLVALVRAGARFQGDVLVERPDDVQEVAA